MARIGRSRACPHTPARPAPHPRHDEESVRQPRRNAQIEQDSRDRAIYVDRQRPPGLRASAWATARALPTPCPATPTSSASANSRAARGSAVCRRCPSPAGGAPPRALPRRSARRPGERAVRPIRDLDHAPQQAQTVLDCAAVMAVDANTPAATAPLTRAGAGGGPRRQVEAASRRVNRGNEDRASRRPPPAKAARRRAR